jgi:hypothetical protein
LRLAITLLRTFVLLALVMSLAITSLLILIVLRTLATLFLGRLLIITELAVLLACPRFVCSVSLIALPYKKGKTVR